MSSFDGRSGANAFVTEAGGEPALLQQSLQCVIGLGAPPQTFAELTAPTGMIMNSWRSTLLSACAPPLSTFIIGTGSTWALAPPT